MNEHIVRGDVYFAELDPVQGSEQGGIRPVLVVQNDRGNKNAPTTIVLPITSRTKPMLPTHAPLAGSGGLSEGSIALAEQIRTLDKSRLRHHVGTVGHSQMTAVDAAISYSLGLDRHSAVSKREIKTLCPYCKRNYEDAGYVLRHIGDKNSAKTQCDFCNTRLGFDYEMEQQ